MTAPIDREPVLRHLAWGSDPKHVQEITRPIGELAYRLVEQLPPGYWRTETILKLVEARDCAVRALAELKPENRSWT